MRFALALAMVAATIPTTAHAFIFPEHRDIGVAAIERLSASDRAALDQLWRHARPTFLGPVCTVPSVGSRGLDVTCVDFADLAAIAGDHSCSPHDVVQNVVPGGWVLGVEQVAAETKAALLRAHSPEAIYNRTATMHLELQGVDPEYLSRAGANNAHFLLARESDELNAYVAQALQGGAALNALGLYLQYHLAALDLAQALATNTTSAPRAVAARDVLVLESFACHWLEDMFAAGHAAGTWGADAWRKGTHDYYNEHGYDTTSWAGERMTTFGDANMRKADLARASKLVAASVAQILAALQPGDPLAVAVHGFGPGLATMVSFDSCKQEKQPAADVARVTGQAQLVALLRDLPTPGRGTRDAHLPRFREEFGPFLGAFGGASGTLNGGTGSQGVRPAIELVSGVRAGYSAPAISGTFGTSNAFLEVGLVIQSSQAQNCGAQRCADISPLSGLVPRVPARTGLRLGVRLPFYLIPGDMLLLTPVLLAVSPRAVQRVGIKAMQGGLIPYERSFLTPLGSLQLVAGREVDFTLFGYFAESLEVRPINATDGGIVATRSMRARFPVVEWTPLRSFATNLAFAVPIQLGVGFEAPLSTRVVEPKDAGPIVVPGLSWNAFLQLQLDVQYFLGQREDLR